MARVIVTRAFMLHGERQEPGTVVEVDDALVPELAALGRAQKEASAGQEETPSVMTTASTPGLVSGRKRKGS